MVVGLGQWLLENSWFIGCTARAVVARAFLVHWL